MTTELAPTTTEHERWYRAVVSRDDRFDGTVICGVTSTGIYCRPSCPTPIRPKRENIRFFPTAAAAQRHGFRACKRCRPDATPGSPEWDVRSDLVGRAMRLIADGEIDRSGVRGVAQRLAVSERHLGRVLTDEVGAGPLALARAERARTARVLIETTTLPFSEIAFAAGFGSIRQFNDTVKEIFALPPSGLRAAAGRRAPVTDGGTIQLRLPFRQPLAAEELIDLVRLHVVPGVEELVADGDATIIRRTLTLPGGPAAAELVPGEDHIACSLRLSSLTDLTAAVTRCRRWLDLDADPAVIGDVLGSDPALASTIRHRPGLRVLGCVDGFEQAVRTIVGQQVSLAGARTVLGRIVDALAPVAEPDTSDLRVFPGSEIFAEASDDALPLPTARRRAITTLARAVADGEVDLDPGADRVETRRRLLDLPGIGPWTADIIAMRALRDPDAFPSGDLVLRKGAAAVGLPDDATALTDHAERWRPWRAYATSHLWSVMLHSDGRVQN